VIYQLATEYALCDQWFASMPGPTWPNRFFVHGASSSGLDHSPTAEEVGVWEAFDGFRYPHGSIYDAMNSAGISWRLYHDANGPLTGSIPHVSSLHNISIFDIHSLSKFSSELQNNYPYRYTFIEPNYGEVTSTYEGGSSQHPRDGVFGGEQLIKTVYEAIRNSPVWASSMLIITYDEHGGFYDSFAPGGAAPPNDTSDKEFNQYGFNFAQAGVRVPAVVVSPYVSKGFVDHTVYDHTSILATLEALCGLKALTDRDGKANNLLHLVQPAPRAGTDCPATLNPPAPAPPRVAMTAELRFDIEQQPLPSMGNLSGFLSIMLKADLEISGKTPAQRAAIIARFKRLRTRRDAQAYIEYVMNKVAAAKAAPPPK
jgi:phospholipase C